MMTITEYQKIAHSTCIPECWKLWYFQMGLLEEVGEACGKIKRMGRGDRPEDELWDELAIELGDALWYTVELAVFCGLDLGTYKFYSVYSECVDEVDTEELSRLAISLMGVCFKFAVYPTTKGLNEVLLYIDNIASVIEHSMEEIAIKNNQKLAKRFADGKIKGSGDSR